MRMRIYRRALRSSRARCGGDVCLLHCLDVRFGIIAAGSILASPSPLEMVGVVSGIFGEVSGIAMATGIGSPEVLLALSLTAIDAILSLLPATLLYRRPVVAALRGA
jgi:hypothetical protein